MTAVYDCNAEDTGDSCGGCVVCLETLLGERTRDLEALQEKAAAWDALVEMRGEIEWNELTQSWHVSAPIGRDEVGLVVHARAWDPCAEVAVGAVYSQWVDAGRVVLETPSEDDQARVHRYLDDRCIAQAEEILARRGEVDA